MKPLYTHEQYETAKSNDKLPCECYYCSTTFYKMKKQIKLYFKGNSTQAVKYCSKKCESLSNIRKIKCFCSHCNAEYLRIPSQIKRSKSGNGFCSQSCMATYNNKHKTTGTRISKLEIWLQNELTELYPDLEIHYNRKDAIGSELDIYIPSLNLAIELNGIFHYEPIYGVDKLLKIQENDQSKSKACHDAKIDLCIIDTSQQKYVKPKTSQKYLDIIIKIINERLR